MPSALDTHSTPQIISSGKGQRKGRKVLQVPPAWKTRTDLQQENERFEKSMKMFQENQKMQMEQTASPLTGFKDLLEDFCEGIDPVNVCSCSVHLFPKNWSFELYRFYSAFTETGATQTMKTNEVAELKQ